MRVERERECVCEREREREGLESRLVTSKQPARRGKLGKNLLPSQKKFWNNFW